MSEEEFGRIIVKKGPNGELVKLRDVARIELGASEYSLRSLLNNKGAVAIPIFEAPGGTGSRIYYCVAYDVVDDRIAAMRCYGSIAQVSP